MDSSLQTRSGARILGIGFKVHLQLFHTPMATSEFRYDIHRGPKDLAAVSDRRLGG